MSNLILIVAALPREVGKHGGRMSLCLTAWRAQQLDQRFNAGGRCNLLDVALRVAREFREHCRGELLCLRARAELQL